MSEIVILMIKRFDQSKFMNLSVGSCGSTVGGGCAVSSHVLFLVGDDLQLRKDGFLTRVYATSQRFSLARFLPANRN